MDVAIHLGFGTIVLSGFDYPCQILRPTTGIVVNHWKAFFQGKPQTKVDGFHGFFNPMVQKFIPRQIFRPTAGIAVNYWKAFFQGKPQTKCPA